MTYIITKDFAFSYSHQLEGLREGHPCSRCHGHNGIVRIELASADLDSHGFVVDYGDLAPFGAWLDTMFDHRHLNDVVDFQPTAELLARHAYEWARSAGWPVTAVSWSETPKTWACFRPTEGRRP